MDYTVKHKNKVIKNSWKQYDCFIYFGLGKTGSQNNRRSHTAKDG